jgi:hypothetical protein
VSSRTCFQAVKVEVASRNFHPPKFHLGVVFFVLAEDLARAFSISGGAGGPAPTKMLIRLEGAHGF